MPPTSMREFLLRSSRLKSQPRMRLENAGMLCVRDLYYLAGRYPADAQSDDRLVRRALADALDDIAIREADGISARAHEPVTVTMGGFSVRGVADLVLVGRDGPTLVSDLQVVGEEVWRRVQIQPRQEHRAKVNLYAFGLGSPRWSICYVNFSNGEIHEHFGDMDEFAAKRDFGLFEEVGYWVKKGVPPPRPYEDEEEDDGSFALAMDQFPCRFCQHRKICWTKED